MIAARARGLGFTYAGRATPALAGMDLDVHPGSVTLLVGSSGGGKTTLLRALSGVIPHLRAGTMRGSVEVAGADTRDLDPARLGLAVGLLFQDPEAQAVMASVWRDVAFAPQNAGRPAATVAADAQWGLAAAGASHLASRRIDELSSGERQRVALAGVLAARPRILLLDEPTSQLDDAGARALSRVARGLADTGTAVLVSEHRADRLSEIADRVIGVEAGELVWPETSETSAPPAPRAGGPVLGRLVGVAASYGRRTVLGDCDLELRAGTVTALVGANGSGKTTLLRVLAGLHTPSRGAVVLEGRDVTSRPIEARVPAVGFLAQDPGRHLLTETASDEIDHALRVLGGSRSERRRRRDEVIEEAALARLADRHPQDLSVGERERVALAAALAPEPRLLLLDEPTRGLDPARKADLSAHLRAIAAGGSAVLVATHDESFASAVADRRLRLAGGRVHPEDVLTAEASA